MVMARKRGPQIPKLSASQGGSDFVRESRDSIRGLTDIPNVGKATAQDLLLLGIQCPKDLIGKDALQMFDELCKLTHQKHDPCVIDVFLAAVDFMEGAPKAPWWDYTPHRKRLLEDRDN